MDDKIKIQVRALALEAIVGGWGISGGCFLSGCATYTVIPLHTWSRLLFYSVGQTLYK